MGWERAEGEKREEENSFALFLCSVCTQSQSIYEIPNTGLVNATWQPSLL